MRALFLGWKSAELLDAYMSPIIDSDESKIGPILRTVLKAKLR